MQENKDDFTEEAPPAEENPVVEAAAEENPAEEKIGAKNSDDVYVEDFDRDIERPKKKKFGWIFTVLLLVAIGLGVWAMFGISREITDAGTTHISDLVRQSSWVFALVCLAVVLCIFIFDWFKYFVIISAVKGRGYGIRRYVILNRLGHSLKVNLIGKFYDNVTPFAVGGQPMQIYYLHKRANYSGGEASAVVLVKYFFNMTSMCLVSLLVMACNTHVLGAIEVDWARILIHVAAWVGIAVNMFLPLMVLFFVIFPKFATKLATFVIGIGFKIKIVKNKEEALAKALKTVTDFRAAFKLMAKKPKEFIALVLLCLAEDCLRFALPFFIMKMFNGLGADAGFAELIKVMALNVFVTQSVCIIPTPGNSGAIESIGTIAFTAVLTNTGVLGWSVLVWRFFVFYIYIIIGIGLAIEQFIYDLRFKICR
ncbi:MAG: flippase-like domain-containing protein [Clostridia bacterium]|nr:flippase-like domain-containing protein [Clostridia bacterium]